MTDETQSELERAVARAAICALADTPALRARLAEAEAVVAAAASVKCYCDKLAALGEAGPCRPCQARAYLAKHGGGTDAG